MRFSFKYLWIYGGLIGLVVFLGLYRSFGIYGGTAIQLDKDAVKKHVIEIWQDLGVYDDSLYISVTQFQNRNLYSYIREHSEVRLSPSEINNQFQDLTGWQAVLMTRYESYTGINPDRFYDNTGLSKLILDQQGNILSMNVKSSFSPRLETRSDFDEYIDHLADTYFGVDQSSLAVAQLKKDGKESKIDFFENENWDSITIDWLLRERREINTYLFIRISNEVSDEGNYTIYITEMGLKQGEFDRHPTLINLDDLNFIVANVLYFLAAALFLYLLFRQLFRGEIIWKRVFFIGAVFSFLWMIWRVLVLFGLYKIMDIESVTSDLLIGVIFCLVIGTITSLGYITWESVARRQKQHQLPLFDAAWRGRFYFQETGLAIIYGYALAGMILGFFALGAYGLDIMTYISDGSGVGFIKPIAILPFLSIWINTWLFSWFVCFAVVGIVTSVLSEHIKNDLIIFILSVIVISFIFHQGGWIFSSTGSLTNQVALIAITAVPVIFALRYIGMFTTLTGWAVAYGIYLLIPFANSSSGEITGIFYAAAFLFLFPLAASIVAYFRAPSVEDLDVFIPEYQQRLAQQVHYEKEIQMAKDSQMTLLPQSPPECKGVDINGFFIPSLDVGGDYYDFNVKHTDAGQILQFTVADVSGKGMKAAMNAIFTSGLILSRLSENNPAEILSAANTILKDKTESQVFITCLQAEYNPARSELLFVNAGNCRPVLKRNGEVSEISSLDPRFPLGMKTDVIYKNTKIKLQSGDLLLFYSDGLPEAKSEQGEYFGDQAIFDFMMKLDADSLSSSEICNKFKKEILNFSNYELADDVTVIALKVE